jgi:D-serine deaminase-like pyridoxal phosphate-dependent protein
MITIRTMKQLATSRSIPSFRSAPSSMGISSRGVDRGRMAVGYSQVMNHETRRQVRNQQMRLRNSISN